MSQLSIPKLLNFVEKVNAAISRARDCLISAQARMKRLADQKGRDVEFAVGDEVLLSTKYLRVPDGTAGRKLANKWTGPFPVVRQVGAAAYELDLPNTMPARLHDVFHVSLLKPYVRDPNEPPPPVPNFIGTEPEWEVERVLDHKDVPISAKSRRTRREYFVKWLDYGHESNSWVPEADFANCKDLLEKYYISRTAVSP